MMMGMGMEMVIGMEMVMGTALKMEMVVHMFWVKFVTNVNDLHCVGTSDHHLETLTMEGHSS